MDPASVLYLIFPLSDHRPFRRYIPCADLCSLQIKSETDRSGARVIKTIRYIDNNVIRISQSQLYDEDNDSLCILLQPPA